MSAAAPGAGPRRPPYERTAPVLPFSVIALCDYAPTTSAPTHTAYHQGMPCPYYVASEIIAGRPDPRDYVAEWRIPLDKVLDAKGLVPLSLNSRLHWTAQYRVTSRIKAATRNAVSAADVPTLEHVHVELHYRPKTAQFRDIDNIVATLKPVIDALHQPDPSPNAPVPFLPIVRDDDPRYVTWSPPILHPPIKGHRPSLWMVLRSYSQPLPPPEPAPEQTDLFDLGAQA